MKYYYLIAGLPTLSLDDAGSAAPPSIDQFRETCRGWLSSREFTTVEEVLGDREVSSETPFLAEWRSRETQLRNAVVRQRAARLNLDAEPFMREHGSFDSYTEKFVINTFSRPSPLDREMELDRYRWKTADDLAGFDLFSLSGLLSYALKLRMVHRWARMNDAHGQAKLEELAGARS